MFESVALMAALVDPTVVLGNVNELGESPTEPVLEAPVPVKLTDEVVAVEVSVAVRVPVAVGLNVTLIVQLPPAASELPQVLVSAKSPASTPAKPMPGVMADEVVFDIVAVCAALVVPTVVLGKVKELGDRVTDPDDVPWYS